MRKPYFTCKYFEELFECKNEHLIDCFRNYKLEYILRFSLVLQFIPGVQKNEQSGNGMTFLRAHFTVHYIHFCMEENGFYRNCIYRSDTRKAIENYCFVLLTN